MIAWFRRQAASHSSARGPRADLGRVKRSTWVLLAFVLLCLPSCQEPKAPQAAGMRPPPRTLSAENAEQGLFQGMAHLFTIPNYFDYGNFEPQECTELPGKLFRAKARAGECPTAFLISGQDHWYAGEVNQYRFEEKFLYAAWRVKRPTELVPGGKYSYVYPAGGPWQVWMERGTSGEPVWKVEVSGGGGTGTQTLAAPPSDDGWDEVRLTLQPDGLEIELNRKETARYSHGPYPETFRMHVGAAQTDPTGAEVVSEYRHFFFNRFPFPHSQKDVGPDGPEDVRPEDEMIRNFAIEATAQSPRHTEGDIIEMKDGSLLLVWSDYFDGEGWDRSPARLSAKVSNDGGKTWGEKWTAVEYDPESPSGNVMSVSLIRTNGGDILMAYHGELPSMNEEGTVLRRSSDEGRTWSEAKPISPDNGNAHAANNACFRRLKSGRLVLSSREYIDGIRWPYALYSDDDGETWIAGRKVPAPELTPKQVQGQNVNEPTIGQLSDGRLLMMMRSIAGGNFFAYSEDEGETWAKPYLSPLRGVVAPGYVGTIPSTGDVLAIWCRGLTGRTPLNSAVSRDGGKTWSPVKLLDRSEYHGYGYTSVDHVGDRVVITTMRYPLFSSIERFQVQPGYTDLLFLSLPVEWFYRMPERGGTLLPATP